MYCPQCGTESTSGQGYCRACGANIKVIGKAVSLSEAIARSDRGPIPKIKEMMKSLKIEQVTEDVSRALDQMNKEIVRSSDDAPRPKAKWLGRREKTAAERRENHIVKGTISLFSGAGLTIFLYYLTGALVLKLPAHIVTEIPFEIDPVVRVLWLFGLIPALSGLGRIIAGLTISTRAPKDLFARAPQVADQPPAFESERDNDRDLYAPPASVTERTTNILHHTVSARGTSEIEH